MSDNELTTVEAAEQAHADAMRALDVAETIHLDYAVKVYTADGHNVYFSPDGCKFFKDEHDIQWISFVARNGSSRGMEHMVRTEGIIVVRYDGQTYLDKRPAN